MVLTLFYVIEYNTNYSIFFLSFFFFSIYIGRALQEIYFALSNSEANLDLEKIVEKAGPAILDLPKYSKQVLMEEAEKQQKLSAEVKTGLLSFS